MDISLLPDLVLDRLVECLSTKDLLRCSVVNSKWRDTFNKDRYWKKICLTWHNKNLYEFLDGSCLVEPAFDELNVEDSTLQYPCEWKVNFMRAKHLEESREKGRYIIRKVNGPVHYCQDEYIVGGSNGDVVYVLVDDNIELWNVSGKPFQIVKFKVPLSVVSDSHMRKVHLVEFIINQEKLIIIQGCILQVYTLSVDGYMLQYRRIIHRPEMDSHNIPDDEIINDWFDDNVSAVEMELQCGVFNNLVFGVYRNSVRVDNLVVWNLETGSLEKNIVLVRDPEWFMFCVHKLCLNRHSEHVFVTFNYFYEDTRFGYNIFKYNLMSGELKTIAGRNNFARVINRNLLFMEDNKEVRLYDFSTEDPILLKTICTTYAGLSEPYTDICFHDPYLALCFRDDHTYRYLINVLDTHSETLETLSSFHISTYLKLTMDLIHDDILIVRCGLADVWNWRKKIKLYSLFHENGLTRIYKNEHFTQLYFRTNDCSKLWVLHFW